jgi:hypothetical protein
MRFYQTLDAPYSTSFPTPCAYFSFLSYLHFILYFLNLITSPTPSYYHFIFISPSSPFLLSFGILIHLTLISVPPKPRFSYHILLFLVHIPPSSAFLPLPWQHATPHNGSWYALSKVRRCLRHNLCSQPYGSKSLVRSTGSAV